MEKQVLPVSQIKVDDKLYPRIKWNWMTSYDYAESMKSGAKFPPITVAYYKKGYYLVDGRHRLEALKIVKEKYVEVEVKRGLNNKEIYLLAVKLNIGHGRQFSVQEKASIIVKLKDMNYNMDEISNIVKISVDRLESFISNRITSTISGKDVVLKAPIRNLSGQRVSNGIDYQQTSFSAHSQIQALEQVIVLMENKFLDLNNEEVVKRVNILIKLFSKLKLVQVRGK